MNFLEEKEKEHEAKPHKPKRPEKNFNFITEKNLIKLVEQFKQPVFFNILPDDAKTIIKVRVFYVYIFLI